MIVLILIVAYLLSIIYVYKFVQKSHYHPYGFNYGLPVPLFLHWTIFIPIINTLFIFILFIVGWKNSKYKKKREFFKPKKPFKVDE